MAECFVQCISCQVSPAEEMGRPKKTNENEARQKSEKSMTEASEASSMPAWLI